MNRSVAAIIAAIAVAIGLAFFTPEWLLDFLPTRRTGPNLIVNSRFETGEFLVTNIRDKSVSLGAGANVIEGWSVTCSTEKVAWMGSPNPFVQTAADGQNFLDLADYDDAAPYGGVEQVIATTARARYELTLHLGTNRPPHPGPIAVNVEVWDWRTPRTYGAQVRVFAWTCS